MSDLREFDPYGETSLGDGGSFETTSPNDTSFTGSDPYSPYSPDPQPPDLDPKNRPHGSGTQPEIVVGEISQRKVNFQHISIENVTSLPDNSGLMSIAVALFDLWTEAREDSFNYVRIGISLSMIIYGLLKEGLSETQSIVLLAIMDGMQWSESKTPQVVQGVSRDRIPKLVADICRTYDLGTINDIQIDNDLEFLEHQRIITIDDGLYRTTDRIQVRRKRL